MIDRRQLGLAAIGLALTTASRTAAQPAKTYKLAFVHSGIPADQLTMTAGPFWIRRFFAALHASGYVEGQNLVVSRHSAEGRHDRFPGLAREVLAGRPDVVVTNYNSLAGAFKSASATVPIVAIVADPVRTGLVASLAQPGGNLTGVSVDAGVAIHGKRLQLLKEAAPSAARVAYLGLLGEWHGGEQVLRDAAQKIGLAASGPWLEEANVAEFRRVFAALREQQVHAVLVSAGGDFLAHRHLIVELATPSGLPVMYPFRDYVELGGLMAYSPDMGLLARHLADDVAQIFKGAPPGDIPVYQSSKFDLVIHLAAAKAFSLPPALLALADEVIE